MKTMYRKENQNRGELGYSLPFRRWLDSDVWNGTVWLTNEVTGGKLRGRSRGRGPIRRRKVCMTRQRFTFLRFLPDTFKLGFERHVDKTNYVRVYVSVYAILTNNWCVAIPFCLAYWTDWSIEYETKQADEDWFAIPTQLNCLLSTKLGE